MVTCDLQGTSNGLLLLVAIKKNILMSGQSKLVVIRSKGLQIGLDITFPLLLKFDL
jgi:hypothetical protein